MLADPNTNKDIVDFLSGKGFLLNKPGEAVPHQYPHCWRCHNPVIFRATWQWFARMDPTAGGGETAKVDLRKIALAEDIERTQWNPPWGQNRIHGMIEARPDWCLSRQRVWGVPIPAFRCTECGKDLLDPR